VFVIEKKQLGLPNESRKITMKHLLYVRKLMDSDPKAHLQTGKKVA
jgi:hypothetical protein